MNPLVSVVIPTYKGQEKLERAINSIKTQTYKNVEIIVVDDNNPDTKERKETEKIIGKLQSENLKYIQHGKNKNGAAARNTGIVAAQGKYVCFLDDDDIYLPTRIEESVNILELDEKSGAVFCDVLQFFAGDKCSIHKMDKKKLTVEGILLYEAAIGTGSNLFLRSDIAKKMNGFDETFLRHQDLEFAIRLFEACSICILNKVLVLKGYNGINNAPQYEKMKEIKKKYNEKFKNEIEALDEIKKKKYYINCYKSLYLSALYAENYSEAVLNLKKMKQYGFSCGIKQLVQLTLAFLHIYHWVKCILERENGVKVSEAAIMDIKEIDSEIYKILQMY